MVPDDGESQPAAYPDGASVPAEGRDATPLEGFSEPGPDATQTPDPSGERLRLALESSRLGLWDWNMQTGEVVFNERWAEIIGRTLEELQPVSIDTWVKFAHPDDLAKSGALIEAHGRGETPFYELECRMKHRDGGWIWVLDRGQIVEWDAEGKPLRMAGTHEDITELKTATEKLRRSEERYRTVVESAASGLVIQDSSGAIVDCNTAAERMLGLTRDQLMGRTSIDPRWRAVRGDGTDFPGAEHPSMVTLATGMPQFEVVMGIHTPDGALTWLSVSSNLLPVAEGDSGRQVIASFTDITHTLDAARAALAESEEQFRTMAESIGDVVLILEPDGRVRWVSPSVTRVMGRSPDDLLGLDVRGLIHPDDVDAVAEQWAVAAPGSEPTEIRTRARWAVGGGAFRWMESRTTYRRDAQGRLISGYCVVRDVEDEVRAMSALEEMEQRFRAAMHAAPAGVAVLDLDRRFVEVNPAFCRIVGRQASELRGRGIALVLDEAGARTDAAMRSTLLSGFGETVTREHPLVGADGQDVWVEHSVALMRDRAGRPQSFVSQVIDVTAARRDRMQLEFLATRDGLTEVLNRRALVDTLAGLLSGKRPLEHRVALLFVDVDDLKSANDLYGHAAGDEVIIEVARRLRATVRADDVVGRVGGDEFVVALPNVTSIDDARAVAEKLHERTKPPLQVGEHSLVLSVSIGLTMASYGEDPEKVLARADRALYDAKRGGRARTVVSGGGDDGTDDRAV